jgi:periplasmic protein TonB
MKDTRLLVIQTVVVLAGAAVLLFGGTALFARDASEKTSEPVYEVGNGVIAPKPIYTPDPEYSEKARKKKTNGTVVVAMIVTQEGRVRDVKITKGLDEGLDKQALAAVRTWKFEPATKDGKPVAVHLNVDVSFRLY